MITNYWGDKLVKTGNSLWLNIVSGDSVEFLSEEHIVMDESSDVSTFPKTETKWRVKYHDSHTDQYLYAMFDTCKQAANYAQKLVDEINRVRSSQSGVVSDKKFVETDYGQRVSIELIDTFYVAKTRQEKISVFAKTVKDTSFIVADFNTWSEALEHMNKLVAQLRGCD